MPYERSGLNSSRRASGENGACIRIDEKKETHKNQRKPKYKKHHRANIIKDRGRRKEAGWRAENGVPTMTHQFSLREQVPVRPRHAHQGPDGKQGSERNRTEIGCRLCAFPAPLPHHPKARCLILTGRRRDIHDEAPKRHPHRDVIERIGVWRLACGMS